MIWSKRIDRLKYLKYSTLGRKYIVIRKSELLAKTQFFYYIKVFITSKQLMELSELKTRKTTFSYI